MEFSEHALVLRTGRFREYDLWVRLLTPTRGVITAFAFGGVKSRRRFCGCLDPLCLGLYRIGASKTGSYLQLKEGDLLTRHARLATDVGRLGMAVNCLKFAEAVQAGPEEARASYDLLCACLGQLETCAEVPEQWPLFFRAKLTFLIGYAPRLDACHLCAKPLQHMAACRFVVDTGRVVCETCRSGHPGPSGGAPVRKAGAEALAALARIQKGGPDEWADIRLGPKARRDCFALVDAFVEYHLGLRLSGGGFERV